VSLRPQSEARPANSHPHVLLVCILQPCVAGSAQGNGLSAEARRQRNAQVVIGASGANRISLIAWRPPRVCRATPAATSSRHSRLWPRLLETPVATVTWWWRQGSSPSLNRTWSLRSGRCRSSSVPAAECAWPRLPAAATSLRRALGVDRIAERPRSQPPPTRHRKVRVHRRCSSRKRPPGSALTQLTSLAHRKNPWLRRWRNGTRLACRLSAGSPLVQSAFTYYTPTPRQHRRDTVRVIQERVRLWTRHDPRELPVGIGCCGARWWRPVPCCSAARETLISPGYAPGGRRRADWPNSGGARSTRRSGGSSTARATADYAASP